MLGRDAPTVVVVDHDARQRRVRRVDQDGRELRHREPVAFIGPQRQRDDDQPVELMAWNFHQPAPGAVGRVDVVQHDLETMRLQRLHDAAQALVRGGLVEERDQHTDEALTPGPGASGRACGAIVQLLHRGMDLRPRRRADLMTAVEHARHRPDAHPCPSSNVGNGRHVVTSPLRCVERRWKRSRKLPRGHYPTGLLPCHRVDGRTGRPGNVGRREHDENPSAVVGSARPRPGGDHRRRDRRPRRAPSTTTTGRRSSASPRESLRRRSARPASRAASTARSRASPWCSPTRASPIASNNSAITPTTRRATSSARCSPGSSSATAWHARG